MTVSNGSAIATAEDFKHAMESLNVEPVELPKSGVLVRLCQLKPNKVGNYILTTG